MQRVEPQRRQFENMPAFLEDEGQSRSMDNRSIAASVLKSVGGKANVVANSLCMTRLRLTIADPTLVDRKALASIPGVLGTVGRGANGLEVVFGPTAVRGVFDTFAKLTGLAATYDLPQDKDLASNFNVQVTSGSADTGPDVDAPADPSAARAGTPPGGGAKGAARGVEDETSLLIRMLEESERRIGGVPEAGVSPFPGPEASDMRKFAHEGAPRLLVINGPNINMLGIREPELYGREDFATLLAVCHETAEEEGFADCLCYQSNHEGDLVDRIQDAYQEFEGIIINPAAYTHTSVALLDALKAVQVPAIEVHLSQVSEREGFRQRSFVRAACFETIMGEGIDGYAHAIRDMAAHLRRR